MNTTKRNSGNWGPQQDKELGDLLRDNQVDYCNRNGDYLFQVTESTFPHSSQLVKAGKTPRSSACEASSFDSNRTCFIQGEVKCLVIFKDLFYLECPLKSFL